MKGREGKGREGKGREGKGREGKGRGTYTHYSTQVDEHYLIISLLYAVVSLYI